jgi:hypothetical protein
MMILSNIKQNGEQIGANDAGQVGTPICRASHDVACQHLARTAGP